MSQGQDEPRDGGEGRPSLSSLQVHTVPLTTSYSVLVVEDDPQVRSYVVETLVGLGYDVLEAGGADQALRVLQGAKLVDLLLTDVVMPGKNGRKLAEEAVKFSPSLKILYMTGYSRNAILHQGRLDADVELIQKPLTSEQLAAAVRKLLDGNISGVS
jgi:CheY-like chemotaxis protein